MRNVLQRCLESFDLLPSVMMIVALTVFLLLAISALVFYAIPRLHPVSSTPIVVSQPSQYHSIVSPAAAPSFDFYTMLPKTLVAVNNGAQNKSSVDRSVPQYALQLAAVSMRNDAQRISDRLALLGYQAMIVPVSQNNQSWFRVLTGPYASLEEAKAEQKKLKKKHITSFSVQLSAGSVTHP